MFSEWCCPSDRRRQNAVNNHGVCTDLPQTTWSKAQTWGQNGRWLIYFLSQEENVVGLIAIDNKNKVATDRDWAYS